MTTAPRPTVTISLLARIEAKPGNEAQVEALLRSAVARADEEPLTVQWIVQRVSTTTFVVLNTFADPAGPDAHFSSPIGKELQANAHLLAGPPAIERGEVIASN